MIRDRGPDFTAAFDAVLAGACIRIVKCAVRAPRMNSIMERWVLTARREILDRTLIWNQTHLRLVLAEFEDHYNRARPHRALRQARPLAPLPGPVDLDQIRVRRHDRLGCLIHEYRQVA